MSIVSGRRSKIRHRVIGETYVGGLVGYNGRPGTVSTSYAVGSVIGASYAGGLAGFNLGSVTHSFWNITTSGQSSSAGGLGMTSAQLQTQGNFTSATGANGNADPGWDFTNTCRDAGDRTESRRSGNPHPQFPRHRQWRGGCADQIVP